jgi:hypothetical protein
MSHDFWPAGSHFWHIVLFATYWYTQGKTRLRGMSVQMTNYRARSARAIW